MKQFRRALLHISRYERVIFEVHNNSRIALLKMFWSVFFEPGKSVAAKAPQKRQLKPGDYSIGVRIGIWLRYLAFYLLFSVLYFAGGARGTVTYDEFGFSDPESFRVFQFTLWVLVVAALYYTYLIVQISKLNKKKTLDEAKLARIAKKKEAVYKKMWIGAACVAAAFFYLYVSSNDFSLANL